MKTAHIAQFSLNPEQSKIIKHIYGAILMLAPVGTGKTRVLSERVIQALKNGISANKILCLKNLLSRLFTAKVGLPDGLAIATNTNFIFFKIARLPQINLTKH